MRAAAIEIDRLAFDGLTKIDAAVTSESFATGALMFANESQMQRSRCVVLCGEGDIALAATEANAWHCARASAEGRPVRSFPRQGENECALRCHLW